MEEEVQINNKEAAAEKLATASLVLGIISLVSTLCCCPFVFSAIGIVLSLLSKGAEEALRPRAKTGLILSIAGLVVSLVLTAFTIVFPIVMYKTNPVFRQNLHNALEESLERDEQLYRSVYGDEAYDQLRDLIDKMEEGDL